MYTDQKMLTFTPLAQLGLPSQEIRVIPDSGLSWFIAKDVATVLGYRNAADMTRNLDEDEIHTHIVHTNRGPREVLTISESGVYSAVLRSRRPEAKQFKRWITQTVIPSIRQHGGYVRGQEGLSPEFTASLHRHIQEVAMPALRYYDKLTEYDHLRSKSRREAGRKAAIESAALRYSLPVALMWELANSGLSALERQLPSQAVAQA